MADVTPVELDNDEEALKRDYARLGHQLRGINPSLCILEQRAGIGYDEFVLGRTALPHRDAIQAMLEERESTGRFNLVEVQLHYLEAVPVVDEPDFMVRRTGKTLAIRREAFSCASSCLGTVLLRFFHAGTVLGASYLILLLTDVVKWE